MQELFKWKLSEGLKGRNHDTALKVSLRLHFIQRFLGFWLSVLLCDCTFWYFLCITNVKQLSVKRVTNHENWIKLVWPFEVVVYGEVPKKARFLKIEPLKSPLSAPLIARCILRLEVQMRGPEDLSYGNQSHGKTNHQQTSPWINCSMTQLMM